MSTSTKPSLKIQKQFTYRGSVRVVSNRYYFSGGTPADSTHWTTLADAVTASEKTCIPASGFTMTIVGAVGYAAGSEVPVFSKTYALSGTQAVGAGCSTPGDAVMLVRYSTATKTSKNHPLYLFNYYHGVLTGGTSAGDTPLAAQRTSYATYGAAWIAGFSDGTNTLVRCGPKGDVATGVFVETTIRHRDLPNG